MIRRTLAFLAVGVVGVMLVPATAAATHVAAKPSGSITVSAASSLTEAFGAVAKAFEKANPGTHVTFNFGASSALEQQIVAGAPTDVFASADLANMRLLTTAKLTGTAPKVFARNLLTIVVEKKNPRHIKKLADLAKAHTTVVLCALQVPCGKYADAALASAHVTVTPASREDNVKGVLTKVQLGEADAGIAYVTDAKAAGSSVSSVAIPAKYNVTAQYPIAALKSSSNATTAKAFIAYVRSSAGQTILHRFGFLSP